MNIRPSSVVAVGAAAASLLLGGCAGSGDAASQPPPGCPPRWSSHDAKAVSIDYVDAVRLGGRDYVSLAPRVVSPGDWAPWSGTSAAA